ncbi:unnamed protein product [Closterium sp. Yama58-4]|nr:unnamed protein product [Closterium sp. Yama58-4]
MAITSRLIFLAALLFLGESLLSAEGVRRLSTKPLWKALESTQKYPLPSAKGRGRTKPPQSQTVDSPAGPIDAIFVFGDSLQDVGNNNYGKSVLQFNIPPYGKNFIPESGRVSDGKLGIDFLAEWMGFSASPPPYLDPNRNATFGVNFASSGASFNVTGYTFPAFQASQQLEWFDKIQADAEAADGADASLPSPSVFSTALYVVGLGSNDYFVLFFGEKIDETTLPRITAGGAKQVQAFASSVVAALKAYVQALYSRGARRFLLYEIPPLGCLPLWRQALQPAEKQGECVSAMNAYAQEHNKQLAAAVAGLQKTLKGSTILLAKTYNFTANAVADPASVGLFGINACCGGPPPLNGLVQCGTTDTIGGYKITATACSRPQDSIFWDRLHPTEAFSRELARSIFLGGKESIVPMNLRQLASGASGEK